MWKKTEVQGMLFHKGNGFTVQSGKAGRMQDEKWTLKVEVEEDEEEVGRMCVIIRLLTVETAAGD